MKLMSSKKNLLMGLTLNKTKLLFNHIEPEIHIQRIFGATENGRIGTEEFSEPVHWGLSSWTMVADITHLIDYGRHKFSLPGQDVREVWMNGRIREGILIVAVVIATRTISTIPFSSRMQHHSVNKQNG